MPEIRPVSNMKTHFTWSIEKDGMRCPDCGGQTVLGAFDNFAAIEGDDNRAEYEQVSGGVQIREELSGHLCPKCQKLVSISFNT